MEVEQLHSHSSVTSEDSDDGGKVDSGFKYTLRISDAKSVFDPEVLAKVLNVDEDISANVTRSIVADGDDFILTYEVADPKKLRSILTNINQQIALVLRTLQRFPKN
jgi:hypothetical protein